jgi:hypothetical protein
VRLRLGEGRGGAFEVLSIDEHRHPARQFEMLKRIAPIVVGSAVAREMSTDHDGRSSRTRAQIAPSSRLWPADSTSTVHMTSPGHVVAGGTAFPSGTGPTTAEAVMIAGIVK